MNASVQRESRKFAATVTAWLIVGIAKLLTGVRAIWSGTTPKAEQTLYFANHTSHGDFVLLWATLPSDLRAITRPVAGQDYWLASNGRRFVGEQVFNALMIKRDGPPTAATRCSRWPTPSWPATRSSCFRKARATWETRSCCR